MKNDNSTKQSNASKPMLSTVLFKDCYRIVNDSYRGYEVQVKRWFFPFFWIEKGCPKDGKIKNGSIVYWKNCR